MDPRAALRTLWPAHGGEDAIIEELPGGDLALANEVLEVIVATGYGPRITSLRAERGANLLAETPDARLEWRPGTDYSLRGGHRLWVAPEVRDLTYTPDDEPVAVSLGPDSISVESSATPTSPFVKTIAITMDGKGPALDVRHELRYAGSGTVTAAAWAITMLRRDGSAILPLGRAEEHGLQADRNIVLWPYTELDDPLINLEDEAIAVHGGRSTATKIGTMGSRGWAAFHREGVVMVKRFAVDFEARYPDLGASVQCYSNAEFCELETLSPLQLLAEGDAVVHEEAWEVRRLGAPGLESSMRNAISTMV